MNDSLHYGDTALEVWDTLNGTPVMATTNSTSSTTVIPMVTSGTSVALAIESVIASYIIPVVIVAGTFGNVTSLAVLLRRRMRRTSVYCYLTALACSDLGVLYLSGFKTWIRLMTGFELLHVSSAACLSITFIQLVAFHMSAWLIVLTTADRFVAVWLPLHAATVCRRRRSCIAVAVLLSIVIMANVHVFWTMGLHREPGRTRPKCGFPLETFATFEYVKLISYTVAPFVIILTLNCAIIARLRISRSAILRAGNHSVGLAGRSNGAHSAAVEEADSPYSSAVGTAEVIELRQRRAGDNSNPFRMVFGGGETTLGLGRPVVLSSVSTSSGNNQQSRVTYMLLVVSLAWLALTAPWALHFILVAYVSGRGKPYPGGREIGQLVTTICFLFVYINHAVNFYLYCVTGRKFRREMADMCCCGVVGGHRAGVAGGGAFGFPNQRGRGHHGSGRSQRRRYCFCCCCSRHTFADRAATAAGFNDDRSQHSELRQLSVVATNRRGYNTTTAAVV